MPAGDPLDPRLPLLVGVAQDVRRPGEDDRPLVSPADWMAGVARAAAADAGPADRLLARVGAIATTVPAAWQDADPGRIVRERLGAAGARTVRASRLGGNTPQLLVSHLAGEIQAGRLDVALLTSAETVASLRHAQRAGIDLGWPAPEADAAPDVTLETDQPANSDAEIRAGMLAPLMIYPLLENAVRAAGGETVDAHQRKIAELWSRFSQVAAGNPFAWTPQAFTADELRVPSADNRQVTFPYTKLLNANIQVDQAAALVLCSVGAARDLGIAPDRWVFVHAGAHAADRWFFSERHVLHRSPALAACGAALWEIAGYGPDDVDHVDLYSCFPSAVQIAGTELGIDVHDPARVPTVTGGLAFAGGPGNGYTTHAVAALAGRLREAGDGARGMATALGWYATKHAAGLYGSGPPPTGAFRAAHPQEQAEATEAGRAVADPLDACATAETATIIYERDGSPSLGLLCALLDDGRRVLAQTRDADALAAIPTDGFLGAPVAIAPDGTFGLAR